MTRLHGLMAGAALAALVAGCSTTGIGFPGFGESSSNCKTIYVYRSTGGIQPISNCGTSVPRHTLTAQAVKPQSLAKLEQDGAPVLQDADAPVVTPVSAAAKATAPYDKPAAYAGANEMLENADMAAFMGRVRTDFSKK